MISHRLIGHKISSGEVSRCSQELLQAIESWRETFKDLKGRGLDSQTVTLGTMDGLRGLEKVFREEFPRGKVQGCQVHVARNVLAKVPRKLKQEVADDIRSMFYASSREKALEFSTRFTEHWQKDVPPAVKCLQNSLDSCLSFFAFPEEERISLRTTNVIQRLNRDSNGVPNRWRLWLGRMPVILCWPSSA